MNSDDILFSFVGQDVLDGLITFQALKLAAWRDDPAGTYRSWFLWDERLKNFRSIRRGLEKVVEEIEAGAFGNVYKGSSLETVVRSIARNSARPWRRSV